MAVTREDREEILELIARYAHAYDNSDIDGYAELFTKDGAIVSPLGEIVGRERIHKNMSLRRISLMEQGVQPRHFQSNTLLVSAGEGEIHGKTTMMVAHQHDGEQGPRLVHSGLYVDIFHRTPDGWRFHKRSVIQDHANTAER